MDSAALDLILSLHTPRKLSRNLTCRYRSREYQIQGQGRGYRLRGSTVTVCESFDGPISLLCQGKTLDYRVLAQGQPPIPTDDEKSLCRTVDKARSLRSGDRPGPKAGVCEDGNAAERRGSGPSPSGPKPSGCPRRTRSGETGVNRLSGKVRHVAFLGDACRVDVLVGETLVQVKGAPDLALADNVEVELVFDANNTLAVPKAG